MAELIDKAEVLELLKYWKHLEAYDKIAAMEGINVVWCKECKWEWSRRCPPHRMGLIHDASDYCSYGIRKTDGVDKHDKAVEALGHLIQQMKGADDE